MPLFGNIIVIKRNGTDGICFPLTASSCLFGRRTECDIRIQLPQVSKEHCKIEVNENKEAILTNLSTINPTRLNGDCFQHPVPLKHGDVLTIIDRSFRFEYPLPSTPRKKRSRSPRDETLQVLHVQQVAEVELLHKPTSGSKSLHASDNAEWEEKNANEKKQSTEEKTCQALPVKLHTPKSAGRALLSVRRQCEMSPFSKLYEKLKCEMKVQKTSGEGNVCHQAAKGDGKSVLLEPSARTSLSCFYDLGSLTREKARSRSENIEECKIKGEVTCSELNQISTVGSATRKSFTRSPRASVSKEIAGDPGERNHLQDHKELSTEGSSEGTEFRSRSSKEKDANAAFSLKPCIVECLDCADKMKIHSCPAAGAKLAQRTNTANVSEVDKYVLSPPTSRRRSPWSHFIAPPRESSGMDPVYTDTPTTRGRVSLRCQSFPELLAGTAREDSACGNDSLKQLPLAGKECLKPRRNSKQCTPGRAVKEEVLKEICDQANFVDSKEECSETPVSLSNSKSPRRSNRQSKELSSTSVHLETPASGELTSEQSSPPSPKSEPGRQRDRPRASGLLTEKSLETSAVQENPSKTPNRNDKGGKEELATEGHHQQQDLEDACEMRPRRLSSRRRSSGSAALLKDNEAVSEVDVSDLLTGGDSGKTKTLSQKRKSGGVSLQPLEKRKRVSFGGHLSPELFDKSLPPNSPIKRGAIPARLNLPFGDSPRAVLKKAQGLKRLTVQEHLQKETMSPKDLPAGKSPAASSPASGKARPTPPLGSPAPFTKKRFSVSHITTPSPIAEEKDAIAENVNTKEKRDPRVKTPKSSQVHPDDKTSSTNTPDKLTKTAQLASKVTPMRRSGAVAVISAKRRSGASSANLLVAKSWAEVVKLGVARPQSKTVKRSVRKGRSLKKKTTSPKTPERKIKGHFSTGHAESPATIVVGRAYSTTVTTVGQVPKVVKNPIVMLNMNMDESFTGIAEMFQTPENKSGKTLPLASVQKTEFTPTCTAMETSELQTPEESERSKVTSGSVGDSEQEDPAPPCTNSRHKYEDKGNVSQGEDSQQREAPSEDGSAQRPTKGRSRKTKVHCASAKQRENHLNSKELQSLGEKSTQEEMEEISTSVAKRRGRVRKANLCIQEEMVLQHPHQEEVETDSFVGGHGAPQRARRGKRKNPTELKHPSENLESCGKDSSVVGKQRANRKQTLQECGINGILETEDDLTISSSIQKENCQLQTGLKKPENKPEQGGVDVRGEMLHFFNKIPAAGSDSPALNHRQRARNEQGMLKPKQTDIPQENPAQKNGTRCRRLKGRNVNFDLEEGSFKVGGGNMVLPECDKGMTCKDGQCETSENPSLQVRRSRRRQVESILQVPCVPSVENQRLIAGDIKDEASLKEQDSGLAATPSSTQENPPRRGKRREVAAASPTPRSPPVRRRGLPKGDDKKMSVREQENPALGKKILPAKTNASARGAKKRIDLGGEVETGNIEEGTNEEQNMSLETVSSGKEKPLGRGRKTGTALASHTTNAISLRGKRRLPADTGREAAPKEYRKVPLQTFDSPVKEDKLRRGRRIGIALLLEGTNSVQGKQGLPKRSTRNKLILASQETPEEQQNGLLAVAPLAKGNPSGVVRKKRIPSRCEETTSPFLRKDPASPRDQCQKRIKTQEVAPEQQATASSLRRKRQLPADDLASKKLRSGFLLLLKDLLLIIVTKDESGHL
ncbi:proliferation marker protein Ki-67 [Athene cunicularia]|uniref:proliferation marker protein Ki-67 n=1 Tax=Athene cunicularia TaxID=194338 RepID=UPI000EF6D092|nr:proliferation marker protein Ki-67 [Athene cunicularia]